MPSDCIKLEKNQIIHNLVILNSGLKLVLNDRLISTGINLTKQKKNDQFGKVADLVSGGIQGLLPPKSVKIVKAQRTENVFGTTLQSSGSGFATEVSR